MSREYGRHGFSKKSRGSSPDASLRKLAPQAGVGLELPDYAEERNRTIEVSGKEGGEEPDRRTRTTKWGGRCLMSLRYHEEIWKGLWRSANHVFHCERNAGGVKRKGGTLIDADDVWRLQKA